MLARFFLARACPCQDTFSHNFCLEVSDPENSSLQFEIENLHPTKKALKRQGQELFDENAFNTSAAAGTQVLNDL